MKKLYEDYIFLVRTVLEGGRADDFSGDFEKLLEERPELVIFGSGQRLRFPSPSLLRSLLSAHIGVETMDTSAACRTHNVLLAEGRCVVSALLFESVALR